MADEGRDFVTFAFNWIQKGPGSHSSVSVNQFGLTELSS